MSDEIKTPRTDNMRGIHGHYDAVSAEFSGKLERELIALQASIRELELEHDLAIMRQKVRELQAAAVPDTHRTCTECHRLLPACLFPKLHGNESICSECYFPCGGPKL